jgi:hypothetical protein
MRSLTMSRLVVLNLRILGSAEVVDRGAGVVDRRLS